jgi:NADPH:quinone reductase
MVGQAATAIARWRGAEPIVADRHRPDGVEHFIDASSSDIREAVLELTDGRGADMALDTVGGALFEPAISVPLTSVIKGVLRSLADPPRRWSGDI